VKLRHQAGIEAGSCEKTAQGKRRIRSLNYPLARYHFPKRQKPARAFGDCLLCDVFFSDRLQKADDLVRDFDLDAKALFLGWERKGGPKNVMKVLGQCDVTIARVKRFELNLDRIAIQAV
jgi:hypothetical protein